MCFWWNYKCVDLRWPACSWIHWEGKREPSKAQNNRANHQTPSQHKNTHTQLHMHAHMQASRCIWTCVCVCTWLYTHIHKSLKPNTQQHHFIHPPVCVFVHLRPEQCFPVSLHSLVYRERKLSPCRHKITGVEKIFSCIQALFHGL